MKIYSWNVNGIRAVIKKGALEPFMKEHTPDILCLQETKIQEQHTHDVKIPSGYHALWNSAEKKGYSGTALLSKHAPLEVYNNFVDEVEEKYGLKHDGYGNPAEEGRVITAEFEHFYVVSVYTPNSKGDLSRLSLREKQWDPAFFEHVQTLGASKPVIFCGDLNVAHTENDLARPKDNVGKHGFTDEERAGFQRYVDGGFVDTFRKYHTGNGHYSWWTHWANARARNVGWRIDYILTSQALEKNVVDAKIHPDVMGSDHCPVSATLDI